MTNMLARGSNPLPQSMSIQDKLTRNKRKFRTDQSMPDSNSPNFPFKPSDCPNYSLFSTEKSSPESFNLEHLASVCDMCKTLMCGPEEGIEWEEGFQDADWSDVTETRLEEILMSNLDMVFKNAIKIVTCYGYTEESARNAVIVSGTRYSCKEPLSGIVDSALALLRGGQELDLSKKEGSSNLDEELEKMQRNVLASMLNLVNESQPFFSTGDAMWCLLICDMNVPRACSVDYDPCNVESGSISINETSVTNNNNNNNNNNSINSNNSNTGDNNSRNTVHSETPKVLGIPNLPNGRSISVPSNVLSMISNLRPDENQNLTTTTTDKLSTGKKSGSGGSKKDSVLRNKSINLEKSLRALGYKASSKSCKHGLPSNSVLDRKCKYTSSDPTTGITVKSTFKLSKLMGGGVLRKDAVLDLSFHTKTSITSNGNNTSNPNPIPNPNANSIPDPKPIQSVAPKANTDLSLSLQSPTATPDSSNSSNSNSINNSSNNSKIVCKEWVPQDKKDEMDLKLVPHVRELQAQLQDWTDWAQQKVMQAARRLAKDKEELLSLRQEKDEVGRLQEERKSLEESTRKKLAEMEAAIAKAGGQVERANSAARRLEMENAQLRLEMEAAKLQAATSAENCRELSKKEVKSLKTFQSWEMQRALLQEELVNERNKIGLLQQQLDQAKEFCDQLKAKWREEMTLKNEARTKLNCKRKERDQIETSARAEENSLLVKAENDLQRYKIEIRALEQQIQRLRLSPPPVPATIPPAAPKWGPPNGISYAARVKSNSTRTRITVLPDTELPEEVQRERECVMCLSEEMSVVFLPCAHQVVCIKCNEIHESQGMKDCPSCRAPIQRRICVRSAE